MLSNLLSAEAAKRESSLNEVLHEILCKITARPTKDCVMQSLTFLDGHCVRRTTLPRDGNVRRNSDDVFVWEYEGLLLVNFRSRFKLCVTIQTNVAQFLNDIPSNTLLCGGSERESSLSEVLHEILCAITASQTKGGVMRRKTVVDGHCVRHAVPSCVPKRTRESGSPCTWRARGTSQTWSASCALGLPWSSWAKKDDRQAQP